MIKKHELYTYYLTCAENSVLDYIKTIGRFNKRRQYISIAIEGAANVLNLSNTTVSKALLELIRMEIIRLDNVAVTYARLPAQYSLVDGDHAERLYRTYEKRSKAQGESIPILLMKQRSKRTGKSFRL